MLLEKEKEWKMDKYGCNYSSAQVSAKTIIYLGDGLSTPRIHFSTQKNVIIAKPLTLEIKTWMKKDKFIRQRYY